MGSIVPFTLCPVCGEFRHLNIGDPSRWFEERGRLQVYPYRCVACFTDLAVGDRVEVRVVATLPAPAAAGDQGVIEAGKRASYVGAAMVIIFMFVTTACSACSPISPWPSTWP